MAAHGRRGLKMLMAMLGAMAAPIYIPPTPLELTYVNSFSGSGGAVSYLSPVAGDILIGFAPYAYTPVAGWTDLVSLYPGYIAQVSYLVVPATPAAYYTFGCETWGGVVAAFRPNKAISSVTAGATSRCMFTGTAAAVGTSGHNIVVLGGQVGTLGTLSYTGATAAMAGKDSSDVFQYGMAINTTRNAVGVANSGGFYDVPLSGCVQVNVA